MKVILSARCNGMHKAATEEIYIVGTETDQEIEEMACDHGYQATGFEYWFERVEE